MAAKHEVIIVGGGQAGLAASHHLSLRGIDHVVLEASEAPASFWRGLWDSFTLVTTNFMLALPGAEYQGDSPEGHLNRAEVVDYLSRYAENKPVQYNTRVTEISPASGGEGFRVATNQGVLESSQVIIATGAYQNPHIPPFASGLPAGIQQIPGEAYRSPSSLPDGAVLVVGSGQTGTQLAEELNDAGRKVYLSVGRVGRLSLIHI
jgi:putative flavoprotein involved in K+ transport